MTVRFSRSGLRSLSVHVVDQELRCFVRGLRVLSLDDWALVCPVVEHPIRIYTFFVFSKKEAAISARIVSVLHSRAGVQTHRA